jgi:hypothetical protein
MQLFEPKCSALNETVIILTTLAVFLGDTAMKRLVSCFEILLQKLNDPRTVRTVQESICRCIPQIAKYFSDKMRENYLKEHIDILLETKEVKDLMGAAFVTAGLLKCGGMTLITDMKILETFAAESFSSKKVHPVRKIAGLCLYECLSISMGKAFELYLPRMFTHVLDAISENKHEVRAAANATLRTIMGTFSNYAIKNTLPQFLK